MPEDFAFPLPDSGLGSRTYLGPSDESYSGSFDLNAADLLSLCAPSPRRLYVWGRAVYRDVFPKTLERETVFCQELKVQLAPDNPMGIMVGFQGHHTHNWAT